MIGIVQLGIGNIGSIVNMLRYIQVAAVVCENPAMLATVDKIILPGVGHFDKGMDNLRATGFLSALNDQVLGQKKPVLGICLGMQLMANSSEEGQQPGLGWVDAEVIKFAFAETEQAHLRIPHMGWNRIQPAQTPHLFSLDEDERFYFVHSYYVKTRRREDVLATTEYGLSFVSALHKENIYGVQFHPEKSHHYGMNLLRQFASL